MLGARRDNDNGIDSGSVYVFGYDGANWVERGKLTASDGEAGDEFGRSAAIGNETIVIGAIRGNDNGVSPGAVFVFECDGTGWVEETKLIASGPMGHYVAISGDTVATGSPRPGNYGAAYVYSTLAVPEPSKLVLSLASFAALVVVSRERRV